jgi:RNA polymerase sigma-70 factor (ECF subfamily)
MPASSPTGDQIEQYRPAVTRYIRYLVRDAADAEDLAQEALLRAYRESSSLRDPAALASWLYQIATHVSIDLLRQRARSVQRQVEAPVEELPIPDRNRPSPFTIVQQNEMRECVQGYVADLSNVYRAVLLLHDADGLTAGEIAHLFQLP